MPSIEQIYLPACEDLDRFFREAREFFNPIYVEKMATMSAYYSRIPSQTWVNNTGTTAKGFRLGRGWYDPTKPWKPIIAERCEQNSCDSEPEMIQRPGTDSYNYHLIRKQLETEWICVEDLLRRLMPLEEILHFEAGNALITKHVHEEFNRSHYIAGSGHRWLAFSNTNGTYCGTVDDQGWIMKFYEGADRGVDTRYVYVKVDPTVTGSLESISLLSLDMLDDALVDLNDEDDAYRLDLYEEYGMPLLDMIIPDPRTGRDLYYSTKRDRGNWDSESGFNERQSMNRLGINRIIGDYAFSYDRDALRYNVDTAYNTALVNGEGYAFDANDPDTWPRLVRVPRYVKQEVELGCVYVPSNLYRNADFAITTAFVEKGMVRHQQSNGTQGYGSAQMAEQDYAGNWDWRRPDWECNRWRKQGFFQAQFEMSAEIKDPTVMHSFLHRLNRLKRVQGACCPLNEYTPSVEPDCWVCEGQGEPVEA